MSEEYIDFVNSVTSQQSKSHSYFKESLDIMKKQNANTARLLTAALGLIGEGAIVSEIVKKCIFQGKPFDEDAQKKLKSELSDCMWYIAQGCIALNTSIEELIDIYKPLVDDFESEIVTIQISSIDQPKTIELLGKELLPKLKK